MSAYRGRYRINLEVLTNATLESVQNICRTMTGSTGSAASSKAAVISVPYRGS
ncbi:MAG: hypothetical protein ACREVK_13690 [Gammaproteobacteria bacterium]